MQTRLFETDELAQLIQTTVAPTSEEWKKTEIPRLEALLGVEKIFEEFFVLLDDSFVAVERGTRLVAQFLDLVVDTFFGAHDGSLDGGIDLGDGLVQALDALLNVTEIRIKFAR